MRLISAAIAGSLALVLWGPVGAAQAQCSQTERVHGACSTVTTETDREHVTIERSESTAGTAGSSSEPSTASSSSGSGWWEPPPIRTEAERGSAECVITVAGLCRGSAPAKTTTTTTAEDTPPRPPTHASELRRFRPARPGILVEPGGWSLPTLPTNMVAIASRHRVSGELLGWPVVVRFTPVAYHWSFGDGSRASYSHTGSSWRSQGKQQFDQTATSHRYLRPGSYQVSLQVDYRVEFRFEGGSFDDVSGRVSATAPSTTVQVFTVSPLLFGQ